MALATRRQFRQDMEVSPFPTGGDIMPIAVVCPECDAKLRVGDQFAGKKVRCPKCSGVIPVSAEPEEVAITEKPRRAVGGLNGAGHSNGAGHGAMAPAKATSRLPDDDDEMPVKKTRSADADDDTDLDEKPRKKKKKKKEKESKALLIGLLCGGGLLLIGGGVLLIILLSGGGDDTKKGGGGGGGAIAAADAGRPGGAGGGDLAGKYNAGGGADMQKMYKDRTGGDMARPMPDASGKAGNPGQGGPGQGGPGQGGPGQGGGQDMSKMYGGGDMSKMYKDKTGPPGGDASKMYGGADMSKMYKDKTAGGGPPRDMSKMYSPDMMKNKDMGPGTSPPINPGKPANPGNPATQSLAGTNWKGSETLQTYGALEFRFLNETQVTMIDRKETTSGTYVRNGNRITLTFFNGECTYDGTITGQTMVGTARANGQNWNWSVKR